MEMPAAAEIAPTLIQVNFSARMNANVGFGNP